MRQKVILVWIMIVLAMTLVSCNGDDIIFAENSFGEIVSWIKQVSSNFCGAACCAMITTFYCMDDATVDQYAIMDSADVNNSGMLSFGEILDWLNNHGPPYFLENITKGKSNYTNKVRQSIAAGHPSIVPINGDHLCVVMAYQKDKKGIVIADPAGQGGFHGYYYLVKPDEWYRMIVEYWVLGQRDYYRRIVKGNEPYGKLVADQEPLIPFEQGLKRDLPGYECVCWMAKPSIVNKPADHMDLVSIANNAIIHSGMGKLIEPGGHFYEFRDQFENAYAGSPYIVWTSINPFCPPWCREQKDVLYYVVPYYNGDGNYVGMVKISTYYEAVLFLVIVRQGTLSKPLGEEPTPCVTQEIIEKRYPGSEYYAMWNPDNDITGIAGLPFWDIKTIDGERIILSPFDQKMKIMDGKLVLEDDDYFQNKYNNLTNLLDQNYPNPFNSGTVIKYTLPKDGYVHLAIYNVLGQKVKTLINDYMSAGTHIITWDGTNENGNVVSSGIYFYKVVAGNIVTTKKMILMK